MSRAMIRVLSNLGLSIATVVVVLAVVEVGLRLAHVPLDVHNVQFDSALGWRGIPNFKGTFTQPFARFPISQNSRGFRDDERQFAKPEGTKRVLCVGDSFTWGWGAVRDEIYTQVLGRMLAAEGRRVEVINAGVKGYGTVQCLLYLLEEGFEYAPDVVIYQVCMNDIDENATPMFADRWPRPYGTLTEGGELAILGYPVPRPSLIETVKYEAIRRSYLARYLRERGVLFRIRHLLGLTRVPESVPAAPAGEVDYPFRLFAAAVRRTHDECAERGVRLVVLIDFNVTPERMEYWRASCAQVETHFVRPYLDRASEAHGVPTYIPNDNHWTPEAHTWIAEYLMAEVLPKLGAPAPP
jgi:lysophospholipase L1-like esterase